MPDDTQRVVGGRLKPSKPAVSPAPAGPTSEGAPPNQWLERGVLAFGAVGTVVGVGTWLGAEFVALLAFVAGGGWALCVALMVLLARTYSQAAAAEREWDGKQREFEVRIADLRDEVAEWRTVARNDSETLRRVVEKAIVPVDGQKRPHAIRRSPDKTTD